MSGGVSRTANKPGNLFLVVPSRFFLLTVRSRVACGSGLSVIAKLLHTLLQKLRDALANAPAPSPHQAAHNDTTRLNGPLKYVVSPNTLRFQPATGLPATETTDDQRLVVDNGRLVTAGAGALKANDVHVWGSHG